MAGLVPAIHVLCNREARRAWMPGTSSAKTRFALLPGHDDAAAARFCTRHCHAKPGYFKGGLVGGGLVEDGLVEDGLALFLIAIWAPSRSSSWASALWL